MSAEVFYVEDESCDPVFHYGQCLECGWVSPPEEREAWASEAAYAHNNAAHGREAFQAVMDEIQRNSFHNREAVA